MAFVFRLYSIIRLLVRLFMAFRSFLPTGPEINDSRTPLFSVSRTTPIPISRTTSFPFPRTTPFPISQTSPFTQKTAIRHDPLRDLLDWSRKIGELVELTRTTLNGMIEIAVADNPQIGQRILTVLRKEIEKVVNLHERFSAKLSGRLRRAVDDGNDVHNEIGEVLVGSNGKIEDDKQQLSPGAQMQVNKKYREGVKKCTADPCVSAAIALQDADEGERQ